jgi:hypothetical protein
MKLEGYHIYNSLPSVHILSQMNLVCASYPTSRRSIIILTPHLCLGLPSGLLPSGFPTKTPYATLLSPIHATCPIHLILSPKLYLVKSTDHWTTHYVGFSTPVTLSILDPNILVSTLFSNILNQHSSCSVSDQNNRQNYSSVYLNL